MLERADLIVHHGGSGTLLGAMAQGTPQVLLPKGADQFLNADMVAKSGLAPVLEPLQVTADAITEIAAAALADTNGAARRAARDEIAAMPHPAEMLPELLARAG